MLKYIDELMSTSAGRDLVQHKIDELEREEYREIRKHNREILVSLGKTAKRDLKDLLENADLCLGRKIEIVGNDTRELILSQEKLIISSGQEDEINYGKQRTFGVFRIVKILHYGGSSHDNDLFCGYVYTAVSIKTSEKSQKPVSEQVLKIPYSC